MNRTIPCIMPLALWLLACEDEGPSCNCLPGEICVQGECIPLGDVRDEATDGDMVEGLEDVLDPSDIPVEDVTAEDRVDLDGQDVPDDGIGDSDSTDMPADDAETVPCDHPCESVEDCDDGNVCTDEWCDPYTGCCEWFTEGMNFYPCGDTLYCNGWEYCFEGECLVEEVLCEGETECTVAACDEANDMCVWAPKPDGTDCDDGMRCTGEDNVCEDGRCNYADPCSGLDTGNPCTEYVCSEVGLLCRQATVPYGQICADDDPCNGTEYCDGNVCSGVVPPCFDADPCTLDDCDLDGDCPVPPPVIPDCTNCTGDPFCEDWDDCTLDYCRNVGGIRHCEHIFDPMCGG
jgi:hypothetical protein